MGIRGYYLFLGSWFEIVLFEKVYGEGVTTGSIIIPPPNYQLVDHLVIDIEIEYYKLQMKD